MANKMTKREYFARLRNVLPTNVEGYDDLINFIDHEVELLDKKTTTRKLTPAQMENEKRMEELLAEIEFDKEYTITNLREDTEAFKGLSSQRATALVGIMINQNKLERKVVKGVAYFYKVEQGE
jgi:hypothetical protein